MAGRGGHPTGLRGKEIGLYYASRSRGGHGGARGPHQTPEERKQARVLRSLADDDHERLELSDNAARVARETTRRISGSSAAGVLGTRAPGRKSSEADGSVDASASANARRRPWTAQPARASNGGGPLQKQRQSLPAWGRRDEIAAAVRENQVVVISGETGCGKTTQVPQFILDAAMTPGNIICTQPRRISAVGVAERVAAERGEPVGQSVGYQIRLESVTSRSTALLFCTTGILLRRLQSDTRLDGVTHVIVDEIHERSMDTDFLLILLRDLLPRRPDLRVVLMSATLNADLFASYFGGCPLVHIPGFTYDVKEYFLEDIIEATNYEPSAVRAASEEPEDYAPGAGRGRRGRGRAGFRGSFKEQREHRNRLRMRDEKSEIHTLRESLGSSYSDSTLSAVSTLMDYSDGSVPLDLIASLLEHIDEHMGEGAILVFLPGWEDISRLYEMLSSSARRFGNSQRFRLLPLHSSMPTINQREIFLRPPRGVRKIVLATNIAETSLTIDDVVFVVDSGRFKEKSYDAATNIACLRPEWVSKASARQRRGRAGRVQEGICFHLFSSLAYRSFEEYQKPEMLRVPLEGLCLRVKSMRVSCVTSFLSRALEPPDSRAVHNALHLLRVIGALHDREEELTHLGTLLADIPVDPRLGKMLIYAVLFKCLDPILTIASSLGFRNPFTMPLNEKQAADRAKRELAAGRLSDHAAFLAAYNGWKNGGPRFATRFYLSHATLKMIDDMKKQFVSILSDAGLISGTGTDSILNRNSGDWPLVKAILVAGLFPSVSRVNFGRNRTSLFTRNDGVVKAHPGSVSSAHQTRFSHRWIVYYEKVLSSAVFLLDVTEITPMALCLFGGPVAVTEDGGQVTVETGDGTIGAAASLPSEAVQRPWVVFENTGDAGETIRQLRNKMDLLILRRLSNRLAHDEAIESDLLHLTATVRLLLEEAEMIPFHGVP